MRERELKPPLRHPLRHLPQSLPMRERELKLFGVAARCQGVGVAPHAGA